MVEKKSFKALIVLGCVLLFSFALWSIAAAQDDPDSTPEASAETASERAFLGVQLEDVDGTVVVRDVVADSAAADAGLQEDDVITSVNGAEVSSAAEVADAIAAVQPGDQVTIEYSRDDETASVEVTLGSAPAITALSVPRGQRELRGLREIGITYNSDDQTWEISSLSEDSALYEAGLREGDVITAINGEQYDPMSLARFLADQDGSVTLTVERDGDEQEIEIAASDLLGFGLPGMFNFGFDLPNMPFGMNPSQLFGNGWLGITFVNLNEQTAEAQGVDVTEGALVTEVAADSPAEAAGLLVDDIITTVNGEAVDAEHTLRDRLIAYEPEDTVTLDVLRGGETVQVEVTLGQATMSAGMMPGNLPFDFNFDDFGSLIPDDLIPSQTAPVVPAEPNV